MDTIFVDWKRHHSYFSRPIAPLCIFIIYRCNFQSPLHPFHIPPRPSSASHFANFASKILFLLGSGFILFNFFSPFDVALLFSSFVVSITIVIFVCLFICWMIVCSVQQCIPIRYSLVNSRIYSQIFSHLGEAVRAGFVSVDFTIYRVRHLLLRMNFTSAVSYICKWENNRNKNKIHIIPIFQRLSPHFFRILFWTNICHIYMLCV